MTIDIEKYMPYLNKSDMTYQQKVDWIYSLQEFVQVFVDAAWDFDQDNPSHVSIRKYSEELKDKPLSAELERLLSETENGDDV